MAHDLNSRHDSPDHVRKGLVLSLAILMVVGMTVIFLLQMGPAVNPVGVLDAEPDELKFSLVNQDGRQVTEQDFLGSRLVLFFGFTHCPDVCPTTLVTLGKAVDLPQNADSNIQTRILFVSVDPKRDTPLVLKQYLSHFPGPVMGLTGSSEQIDALSRDFRVHYKTEQKDAKGGYAVTHSDLVYLVSETGKYITHLRAGSDAGKLAAQIQKKIMAFDS